jgi:hypothetical protein
VASPPAGTGNDESGAIAHARRARPRAPARGWTVSSTEAASRVASPSSTGTGTSVARHTARSPRASHTTTGEPARGLPKRPSGMGSPSNSPCHSTANVPAESRNLPVSRNAFVAPGQRSAAVRGVNGSLGPSGSRSAASADGRDAPQPAAHTASESAMMTSAGMRQPTEWRFDPGCISSP